MDIDASPPPPDLVQHAGVTKLPWPNPHFDGSVWDASGSWLTWVRPWHWSRSDVYVSSADGSDSIRVTGDGEPKWCPTLDAGARRVAFYTGEVDDNGAPETRRT